MKLQINAGEYLDVLDAIKATQPKDPEVVMVLKDDRWLMKSQDPASVLMAAVRVEDSYMEHYDRDGYETIAFKVDKVENFIKSREDTLQMQMDERTLQLYDGDAYANIGTLDPASVEGHMDSAPNLDYEVVVKGEPEFLFNFIDRQEGVVGSEIYYIGAREDGIYLYASGDSGDMHQKVEWDEFEKADINWSINNSPNIGHTPSQDSAIDMIMSGEYSKSIKELEDECEIHLANQMPMKFVYSREGGEMMVSYIQAPRIDEKNTPTIPDGVIERA